MASLWIDIFGRSLFFTVIQITCPHWEKNFVKTDPILAFLNFCVIYFHFDGKFLGPAVFNINFFLNALCEIFLEITTSLNQTFYGQYTCIDKIRSWYFSKFRNMQVVIPEGYLEPCQTFRIERFAKIVGR